MREVYLKLLNKHKEDDTLDVKTAKELVVSIYDNFESRTCENCEEFKVSKGFNGTEFTCYKGYGCTNEYGYIFTERNFGCNEFKRLINKVE